MKENWKKDYNITKATLNILLIGPREEFFTAAKLPCDKNKTIAELSPCAKEFFYIFLSNKGKFVIPTGQANYRPYNSQSNIFSKWNDDTWTELTNQHLRLAIMDFRLISRAFN